MDWPKVDCLGLKPDPLSSFPPWEIQSHRGAFSGLDAALRGGLGLTFQQEVRGDMATVEARCREGWEGGGRKRSGGSYGVREGRARKGEEDRDRMEEAFLAAQLRKRCVWAHVEIYTAASWGAGARAQPGAGHEHVDGQACPCMCLCVCAWTSCIV